MSQEIFQIGVLALSVIFSFSIAKVNLHSYDIPIAVILFIALFLTKKVMLPKGNLWKLIEAFVFTLITLFTVLTTGAVNSPFFFLIYFLIFSLSLLFEPVVSLSTSMVIILLFVLTSASDVPFKSLIPIFSLAFMAPFALLLSQERVDMEKMKQEDVSMKENTFLFLSLTLKKHINTIKEIVDDIRDEKNTQALKKQVKLIEKLIEKYEEQ